MRRIACQWDKRPRSVPKTLDRSTCSSQLRKESSYFSKPDYQIERLKFLLENTETEVTIVRNFKVGDSVRVASGPLKGLEGVVSKADEKSSVVGVLIDGLGYACVKIAKCDIGGVIYNQI